MALFHLLVPLERNFEYHCHCNYIGHPTCLHWFVKVYFGIGDGKAKCSHAVAIISTMSLRLLHCRCSWSRTLSLVATFQMSCLIATFISKLLRSHLWLLYRFGFLVHDVDVMVIVCICEVRLLVIHLTAVDVLVAFRCPIAVVGIWGWRTSWNSETVDFCGHTVPSKNFPPPLEFKISFRSS